MGSESLIGLTRKHARAGISGRTAHGRWNGQLIDEAVRCGLIRGHEHHCSLGATRVRQTVMHITRRVQAHAAVAMDRVVPHEEGGTVGAGIFHRAETRREGGLMRERREVGFGLRIVIRDVRTRMRLRHTELHQQERDAGRRHRRAAIGVDRQLPPRDAFATATRRDQPLGELCGFARREHPADDRATEDVEHDVAMRRAAAVSAR